MFTGIIQKVGQVTRVTPDSPGSSLQIQVATGFNDLELGESVAVNGVCLTVTEMNSQGDALFFVSAETLAKTHLGSLQKSSRVNLERALTLATRLSGHMVQGHVDGLGRLSALEHRDGGHFLQFEIPKNLTRYCVEKGSIAIDGVSLTLNTIQAHPTHTEISIALIPHTWEHTRFSSLVVGDSVNIEVDVLAKYVAQQMEHFAQAPRGGLHV